MMSDIPHIRPRDMVARIQDVVDTHEQIAASIRERAEENMRVHSERNLNLNADARLNGKVG